MNQRVAVKALPLLTATHEPVHNDRQSEHARKSARLSVTERNEETVSLSETTAKQAYQPTEQLQGIVERVTFFICYSNRDDMLAYRLHADLQDRGVRCWFAPEDMKIGDKIRARIDEAIYLQEKLLLLLSEHSLASTWVEYEVEAAIEKEQRQQREVLFPISLDEQVMQASQAWAAKLRRTRHIGDFTRWTDAQAYQQAFDRLLRDLKANVER